MIKVSGFTYSGYEIALDGLGSWSLGNNLLIIFGVSNSSSSHTDNRKNHFLVLGEAPTDGIDGSIGAAEKKFSINFSNAKTKFCLNLRYNGNNSYLFVNGKGIY